MNFSQKTISMWRQKAKQLDYLLFVYNATHLSPICTSPPLQVYIETTNKCNLRCSHCPSHTMKREKVFLPVEQFRKIIQEIAPHQPFVDLYLQGEPLLHPDIIQIVNIASEYDLEPRITTNATLLTQKRGEDLIKAGLKKLQVSMSGASPEVYNTICKGANFEKTVNNLLIFLETNAKAGFPVHTRTTFVEEIKTQKDKDKYLSFFSQLPLDDVYVSPLNNMFGYNEEIDLNDFKKTPRHQWPQCKVPWRNLGIGSDGFVRACIFDYDSRYIIGDTGAENVMDIWNNKKMQEYRKAIIDRDFNKIEKNGPLCSECSQIWPTSAEYVTTQLPQNFSDEVETFLSGNNFSLQAKSKTMEEKTNLFHEFQKNKDKWIHDLLK